jgi:hypothetical protein
MSVLSRLVAEKRRLCLYGRIVRQLSFGKPDDRHPAYDRAPYQRGRTLNGRC